MHSSSQYHVPEPVRVIMFFSHMCLLIITIFVSWRAVLWIRDVYPGSRIRIFPSRIPDPRSKRFRIRIQDLSSRNMIWDVFFPSRIPDPDPETRIQDQSKSTGSRIPDSDPQHCWKGFNMDVVICWIAYPSNVRQWTLTSTPFFLRYLHRDKSCRHRASYVFLY
jgi:hypothetical protein